TVSMEMLAEAACHLTGRNLRVVRTYDVRGNRWLPVDPDALTLLVVAERVAPTTDDVDAEVQARIFTSSGNGAVPARQLVFEGRVQLGARFAPSPPAQVYELAPAYASHYTRDMLFGAGDRDKPRFAPVFHGPRFRGITGIRRW